MAPRRLLVLSHVLPFPGSAGQEQRVHYTLLTASERFHVTFATSVESARAGEVRKKLSALCDEVVLLPSRYHYNKVARTWHRAASVLYALATGLKRSNYVIGKLEFSPSRVAKVVAEGKYDCVLFEYWHAEASARLLGEQHVPSVLDMHDVLWQGRAQRLMERKMLPAAWQRWLVERYKRREERAWTAFDAIIAINRDEQEYVRQVSGATDVFYAPMGTDLARWPYSWTPALPQRVAYYGSLGTSHNERSAQECYREIMPEIWRSQPETELWLVGGKPPRSLRAIAEADRRVVVTGFVPDVQEVLRTMTVVVCPWKGTYGFRSRLVEVMALGVPVVTSPDAVAGMELVEGEGIYIGADSRALATHAVTLLSDAGLACQQSRLARGQVERLFSLDITYRRLICDLDQWLQHRAG